MVMYLFASAWKAHVELSVGKKKEKEKETNAWTGPQSLKYNP